MTTDLIINIMPLGFPWQTQDPFIFCAYHRDEYPRGNETMGPVGGLTGRTIGQDFVIKDGWRMYHGRKIPGFPYHPHRGFETITIVQEGVVDHSDSLGAAGRFMSGDVQWMTAGSGVQHSEMFPLLSEEKENPLEIFQIWLNLPKRSKFVAPHFKMLWREAIPVIKEEDEIGNIVEIKLIAGRYKGIKAVDPNPDSWAANPVNDVMVATIQLAANANWVFPKATLANDRMIYFYKGTSLTVAGKEIAVSKRIHLYAQEEVIIQAGSTPCFLLVLQGVPIDEPLAKHGPFVMNTEEEIEQAFQDYRRTQFGGWPWPEQEQVHDKNKGRFALHANGEEELKS